MAAAAAQLDLFAALPAVEAVPVPVVASVAPAVEPAPAYEEITSEAEEREQQAAWTAEARDLVRRLEGFGARLRIQDQRFLRSWALALERGRELGEMRLAHLRAAVEEYERQVIND